MPTVRAVSIARRNDWTVFFGMSQEIRISPEVSFNQRLLVSTIRIRKTTGVMFMFFNSGNSQRRSVGFWSVRTRRKVSVPQTMGVWGIVPQNFVFNLGSRKWHFLLFPGYFQWINTNENAAVTCLFYPPLVSSVRYSVYGKKSKTATLSINEVTMDKKSTLKTGKLMLHVSTSLCLSICAEFFFICNGAS